MSIKFHMPGLRYNFPLNMYLVSMMERYPHFFREGVEIGSFFGEFPLSLWNGGRYSRGDQCDANFIRTVVKAINDRGIPVRYTYTNPLITEADLDDEYCNFCMQVGDNGMNEVMMFSPILEEYIRKRYPSYKINSSTCKEIKNIDALNAELRKDYYLVVLDQNMNNNFEFLDQVEDKKRLEILVNSCCVPNCPRQADHYKYISNMQRRELENRKLPPEQRKPIEEWSCKYGEYNSPYSIRKNSNYISVDSIWEKYIPMGFQHFKIEGRTANYFSLMDTYTNYLCKPEYKDEARFMLVTNLQKGNPKIISVNMPRAAAFQNPGKGIKK